VVEVNHNVRLDVSASVAGVVVQAGAYLRFTRMLSLTLSSTGNVIVYGELRMRPKSNSQVHRMVFTGIDETKFVGGGYGRPGHRRRPVGHGRGHSCGSTGARARHGTARATTAPGSAPTSWW
jgi:hypothetical protein